MALVEAGQRFNSWTAERQLGAGGNGEVWRVRRDDSREAAIKVLRRPQPDQVPYQRFAREVQVLRELGERPGVLPLIEANVPETPGKGERVWYVMPLARPLREALRDKPVDDVVSAVKGIARVLEDLRRDHCLAHRDIKPENLYSWNSAPAVGDFGLVELPDEESLTEPGRVPGAFGYIADEMLINPNRAEGPPADVFSLAKVLWVLLTPGALFPLQGRHQADSGPGSLARTLAVPGADALDRVLEAATRHVDSRIDMGRFAAELDSWLMAPRPAQMPDAVAQRVEAARLSMEHTIGQRDRAGQRDAAAGRALELLTGCAADLVGALQAVDAQAEVGPWAMTMVRTNHYGARVTKDTGPLQLALVVDFCVQVDDQGRGYVHGLVSAGHDTISGGYWRPLTPRSAPVESLEFENDIAEIVQEAREALPEALQNFANT